MQSPGATEAEPVAWLGSKSMRSAAAAAAILVTVAVGCAQPVKRRDWSGYDGPGAPVLQREQLPLPGFRDPLEPLNRSMWAFNHALIVGVADPVGRAYRLVIPRFVRERIRDFAANLVFPRNLVANLLQARWRAAAGETARFAVNTTAGLAGVWDPATRWLGIEAAPEDFGQVFARWGWQTSTFAMLPVAGPSSIRAGVGLLPDAILDPATYFFPAGAVLTFNDLADSIPEYRRFHASSFDFYDDARLVWGFAREARIQAPEQNGAADDTGATQTLEAAFFGPRDPAFAARLATRRVSLPTRGSGLPYSFRMQPGRAPLVLLVPGLGAHRLGASSLALAEMAWERGFSVAIVSSALCFEFIAHGGSVPVPGHAPVDARDVHVALDAIARDLGGVFPDRTDEHVYLGYSLGAFHGFFIAAREHDAASPLLRFDRYLLLDPPVRLVYGMQRLDAFYDVPLAFPEPDRDAEARRILLKAVAVAQQAQADRPGSGSYSRIESTDLGDGTLTPALELPFTNEEAEFLIGVAFRRSLQALVYASQEREDLGVLQTERRRLRRLPAYQEIADYSFEMYLYAFLLPYHRDRLHTVASAEELISLNDLHALADELRGHPKLHVFANRNDFLTSDEDVDWLTALVGPERVRLFPRGGHLGNLHRPEVQAELMAALADLVAPGTQPAPAP
jgi:ABC-type transporter lipoprotein component MlaA